MMSGSTNDPDGKIARDNAEKKAIEQQEAKKKLKKTPVKIATVVNIPHGGSDFANLRHEIRQALTAGADEIDAVFPYHDFLEGNLDVCDRFLDTVTETCGETTTKIILETGELAKASLIAEATRLCLNKGVGFIKTSTGKTPVSATPEAANIILETIAASRRKAGFKASGGIRTIDEAKKYLTLAQTVMGSGWISPEHLRIGASSLLDNLLQTSKQGY